MLGGTSSTIPFFTSKDLLWEFVQACIVNPFKKINDISIGIHGEIHLIKIPNNLQQSLSHAQKIKQNLFYIFWKWSWESQGYQRYFFQRSLKNFVQGFHRQFLQIFTQRIFIFLFEIPLWDFFLEYMRKFPMDFFTRSVLRFLRKHPHNSSTDFLGTSFRNSIGNSPRKFIVNLFRGSSRNSLRNLSKYVLHPKTFPFILSKVSVGIFEHYFLNFLVIFSGIR